MSTAAPPPPPPPPPLPLLSSPRPPVKGSGRFPAESASSSPSPFPFSSSALSPLRCQVPTPSLSPPRTPTQQTVVLSPPSAATSLFSASSPLCTLTVPQLLAHVEALTHSLAQPNSPHPILVCNHCGAPVARHPQHTTPPPPPPLPPAVQQQQAHGHATPTGDGVCDDGGCGGGGAGGGKLLNDPIHGYIHLDAGLVAVIDTPHFQRLRDLKQLGTCYLVFPGASHNRFEHSIGVCHLAHTLLTHLQTQQPELRISDREHFLVKLAALAHDLGHGPFSHVFDGEFIPRAMALQAAASPSSSPSSAAARRWHHEEASIMMLKDSLLSAGLELSAADLQFVSELIDPVGHPTRSCSKAYLYDIVSNARSSLDVDKFDYLARDVHNIGMSTNLRHERLIRHCRVIDGELCFNSKEVYNLYELFHTRYSLFKQVYSHRVSKAIEYMVTDILLLADPVLHISQAIHSPRAYLALTDCLLKQIEVSTQPELQAARALILRIRQRKLYRLVEEAIIPTHLSDMPDVTEADILAYQHAAHTRDIVVQNLRIHYAMKEKNPVDSIRFFDKSDVSVSYSIPKAKVSQVMPERFHERLLRVYIRDLEEEDAAKPKFHAVKAAVLVWLRAHECVSPIIQRTASGALLRRHHSFLKPSQDKDKLAHGDESGMQLDVSGSARPSAAADASLRRLRGIAEEDEEQRLQLHQQRPLQPASAAHGPVAASSSVRMEGGLELGGRVERKRRREDSNGSASSAGSDSPTSTAERRTWPSSSPFAARTRMHAVLGEAAALSSSALDPSSSSLSSSSPPPLSSSPSTSPFASPSVDGFAPPPSLPPSGRRSSTSMDPPSPLLSHPHAHYHVNPTLACHFPTSALLNPSPPPPQSPPHRSASPSPASASPPSAPTSTAGSAAASGSHAHPPLSSSHTSSSSIPSSHRQLSEWQRLKGMDGLLVGHMSAAAASHSSSTFGGSPHLSPHSPRSPAVASHSHTRSLPPLAAQQLQLQHGSAHSPHSHQQRQQPSTPPATPQAAAHHPAPSSTHAPLPSPVPVSHVAPPR